MEHSEESFFIAQRNCLTYLNANGTGGHMLLKDKIALVTGSTHNIGLAIARVCA